MTSFALHHIYLSKSSDTANLFNLNELYTTAVQNNSSPGFIDGFGSANFNGITFETVLSYLVNHNPQNDSAHVCVIPVNFNVSDERLISQIRTSCPQFTISPSVGQVGALDFEASFKQAMSFPSRKHTFVNSLTAIQTKATELLERKNVIAANAAQELYDTLTLASDAYFNNPNADTYQEFKTAAQVAIDEAAKTLDEHRGWKQILGNIMLAIIGLGVFYLVAVAINGGLFFNKTDSRKKLDTLQQAVEQIAPAI